MSERRAARLELRMPARDRQASATGQLERCHCHRQGDGKAWQRVGVAQLVKRQTVRAGFVVAGEQVGQHRSQVADADFAMGMIVAGVVFSISLRLHSSCNGRRRMAR